MSFIPREINLLTEQITPGAVSLISIGAGNGPNLSINRDEVYELVFSTHNPTGSDVRYQFFFNGDSVLANYAAQQVSADGGIVSGARTGSFTSILHLASGETGYSYMNIIKDIDGNVRTYVIPNELANVVVGLASILYAPVGGVGDVTRIDISSIDTGTGLIISGIGAGSVARLYRTSPI